MSGAYELSETCKLILTIPRQLTVKRLEVMLYSESCLLLSANASFEKTLGNNDLYSLSLNLRSIGVGIYFGVIKLHTMLGELFAKRTGETLEFLESLENHSFQLSVTNFKFNAPKKKYGGIIYHIFVDRFARGSLQYKPHSDAVYIEDWDSDIVEYPQYPGAFLKNNSFYGGTLLGIADKLDYIASLGVDTIYLSPIFKAYSNHKYDTGDYMTVDESFGGEDALLTLIDKASSYGIGIILDGVFNHTGANSLYFNKFGKYSSTGAYQSKDSPYYSWFEFQEFPNKYTSWWGIDILPRINPSNRSCGEYFTAPGGVIDKYAAMGIDGFRLDVVDELNDEFIKEIKSSLNRQNKDSILYGEVWEDASNKIAYGMRKSYYLGDELDAVMNYPARTSVIKYIRDKSIDDLLYYINEVMPNAPKRIRDAQMNLLGTHDTERILTILGGESSEGKSNDTLLKLRMSDKQYQLAASRLKLAYTLIATLPGIPSVFYGDEAGMEGYHDPFNRRTFPWGHEDETIQSFYKKVGKVRRDHSVYSVGEFKCIELSKDLFIFKRYDKNSTLLTVINNSDNAITLCFTKPVNALLSNNYSKSITLSPNSAEIVDVDKNSSLKLS